jgi:hypothetical protein
MTTMLVTFDSKAGRVTMFGDVAVQLLRMMGHTGTVPSALLANDIPEALANLKRALAGEEPPPTVNSPDPNDEAQDRAAPVSLRTRAFPLIELLENSAKRSADIVWDQDGPAGLKF